MARMGRPPKPAALKRLTGNAGHRRIRDEPAPLRRGPPQPPEWLSPYALQEWHRIAGELWAMGVITALDEAVLCVHAENVALMKTAHLVLKKMAEGDAAAGLLAKMGSGSVVQNPVLGTANAARAAVLRSASELGLSPVARAGLDAQPPSDADEIFRKYFPGGRNGRA